MQLHVGSGGAAGPLPNKTTMATFITTPKVTGQYWTPGTLIIYLYDLDDGTRIRLGYGGYQPIRYAHHIQKDGKVAVIPLK